MAYNLGPALGPLPNIRMMMIDRVFEPNEKYLRAKEAGKKFREEFTKLGKIKYERVLGHGGFGMVQLWSIRDDDGNATGRSVAIKFPTRGNDEKHRETTRWEMHYMGTVFRNLEHIVQLVDVEKDTPESKRLTNNSFVERPVLVMEALQKCNLFELISWINESRTEYLEVINQGTMSNQAIINTKLGYIPNRVMWRYFFCLLKGIVGMAYPNDGNMGLPVHGDTPIREMIPPVGPDGVRPPPSTYIHFDLDPQNVLVGDVDTGEHHTIPKLKIADFGVMLKWEDALPANIKTKRITRGKTHWYAPEQRYFMRAADPYYHIGHELNIWAIGLIMFNLLTLGHPFPVENWTSQLRMVQGGLNTIPVQTYAWFLIRSFEPLSPQPDTHIERYDFTLRSMIARCMADDTNARPTFQELWTTCQLGIAESETRKNYMQDEALFTSPGGAHYNPMLPSRVESDQLVRKFYHDYFVNPPSRPNKYEGHWSDQ